MQCPRCQAENREGRRFCAKCGAPLSSACPSCGFSNEPGDEFCGGCGQSLRAAIPAPPRYQSPESYTPKHLAEKILTSKSALEGERKQVTVLFADMKGSMELLADRDPEDARKLLDSVLERMMEAVHRYEGTVNQVMGDGIMALFGAPLAHEDHAVRACYAALRMQESVKRYAEEVRRSHGVIVQIRIGLNSGEVVVRSIGNDLHMDYTAVGQITHLAARMEQLASPGSVLMTADTLRLAEGFVQVNSLGPIPVKGLSDPVDAFELLGAGPTRRRFEVATTRGLTRFVGRQTELEALYQALERAKTGHGQIVALVGEPGVGKSRLFWEFTHSHRTQGWLVLEIGSVSYGKATPYFPVIDLLKRYFKIQDRDDQREIREKVTGKLLTLDRALEPALPAFLALLDVPIEDPQWLALDPSQRRQQTLNAVKRLLLRESQVQPFCLVFEDLHWIDSETQIFLDSLIESLPTVRLLLLVNYRPEYQHGWGSKSYYTQLRLDPLPPQSAGELLRALLGEDAGLEPLYQLLIERTEGNPFFLEESVRTLVETQALVGERGAYRLAKALPSIQVPATVQAVLAARIDRLPQEEKSLLQTAAVIGKDVPFALLQAIAELPEEALRHSLIHLQAAEFLYETSLFPDLEYTFKHALTYEVAYGSLLQERRRTLHAKIAEAIEVLYADRLAEQVERLAHHYTEAGLNERAIGYWERAGERAIERSAHLEAIGHLTRGLDLLRPLPETPDRIRQEITLQIALGVPLAATKGYSTPEVEQAYSRARELCERIGETDRIFSVLYGLWRFYLLRADYATARDIGEQLLLLAERADNALFLVVANRALGSTFFYLGEFLEARSHLEKVIGCEALPKLRSEALSHDVADPWVACRSYMAWTLWLLGRPDQARKEIDEAIAMARGIEHPFSLALALSFASWLHQFCGDVERTRDRTDEALALSTEHSFGFWLGWGTVMKGWTRAEGGGGEDAFREMRKGLADWRSTGSRLGQTYFLSLLGEACAKHGEAEEALSTLSEAQAFSDESQEAWWQPEIHRLKGELFHSRGRDGEAEACFHQAIELARRQHSLSLELRATASLSRSAKEKSETTIARRMLGD
ncbi:MAG TPA: adenylate/guanylate cyclase domain-containing protein, partial [Methylomirabilota bacterium]|nr:adenylate/guanylate cyclase domain-containing protein [Methylomirabilota bacterium]